MRKIKKVCLVIAVLITICGCTNNKNKTGKEAENEKIRIVTTIFPIYDWTRQIVGNDLDNVELTMVLNNGTDLHSFQPTPADIKMIEDCNIFIYVGGESDDWIKDIIQNSKNKDMKTINLMEVLGDDIKEEEYIEGMEHTHHHHEEDEHVKDRSLSEWSGTWNSIEQTLEKGLLDSYLEEVGKEKKIDLNKIKEEYKNKWKSLYSEISIKDNSITFNDKTHEYKYIGFKEEHSDHGTSAWYGFEATENTAEPKFLAFNDHNIYPLEKENMPDNPHMHMRYGNTSFDALVENNTWSPTYFASTVSDEEIVSSMTSHSHGELDEHVWLSLKNTERFCNTITDTLSEVNPQMKKSYQENNEKYIRKLDTLDTKYRETLKNMENKTIIVADRFPFRYFVEDYDLSYFAAFSGCSAEIEASFETIVFLANKVDTLSLQKVIVIDNSSRDIANAVIDNTKTKNQKILELHSMQSITSTDATKDKLTYLSIMEDNLEVLKDVLQ